MPFKRDGPHLVMKLLKGSLPKKLLATITIADFFVDS